MVNILSYFIAIMETYISLRGWAGQVIKDGAIRGNEKSDDIIVAGANQNSTNKKDFETNRKQKDFWKRQLLSIVEYLEI